GAARIEGLEEPRQRRLSQFAAWRRIGSPGPSRLAGDARMIQLQKLSSAIGERVVFEGVDWVIGPGDRCALVGPNGAGKTTLIRIVLGEYSPASGQVVRPRGTRIGYLPQEAAEKYEGTVLDRAMEAHRALLDLRSE